MTYAPFNVQNPGSPPENIRTPPVDDASHLPAAPSCSIASRAGSLNSTGR